MLFKVENLNKSYKNNHVLKDLSFEIDNDKDLVALIGLNGSGKSTLLEIICGVKKKDSGRIVFQDKEITEKNADYEKFCEALNYVTTQLAKKMAADGEGATKLLEAQIVGAGSEEEAILLSKSIITSNLVKAAVFGNDANWGRILCAMGYSGADFDPDKVDLYIESTEGKLKLVENGVASDYSEELASKILSAKEVKATADLKAGNATATAWGCDLTYDYVKINADYRS
jgi:glutamate N-acetyltransferase/amino-acid N-acetyltransferase